MAPNLIFSASLLIFIAVALLPFISSPEKRFSLSLILLLATLPLVAGISLFLSICLDKEVANAVLLAEAMFAVNIICLGNRLIESIRDQQASPWMEIIFYTGILVLSGLSFKYGPLPAPAGDFIEIFPYSLGYLSSLLLLLATLYAGWRLEQFWRALPSGGKWQFKFLAAGLLLMCGCLVWTASYRLTFQKIVPSHLVLLFTLLASAWAMMLFALLRHRLLNKKIFISRKVVYSSVIPLFLGLYLLVLGLATLIMNAFGLELSFVIKWLLIVFGMVVCGLFALSPTMRRKIHYFISTHFYVNKYEYRDEWLAFSQYLHGAADEDAVIQALKKVLTDSLYTDFIYIWIGDEKKDFSLVSTPESMKTAKQHYALSPDHPAIALLKTKGRLVCDRKKLKKPPSYEDEGGLMTNLINSLNLEILFPIALGGQMIGIIGLGPEFTEGKYGQDDFDLLQAVTSQAASAIIAARASEELSKTRELQAWDRLSAFVLHDIKNAANMLALLRENAPEHLDEPEFQEDLIELLDDAISRMQRVEKRLRPLDRELKPCLQKVNLADFLRKCAIRLESRLPGLKTEIKAAEDIIIRTDPDLLATVIENLLINSYEAGGKSTRVFIQAESDESSGAVSVKISDNGPGIPEELLPDKLFEPFVTSKKGGSGIGLWQVKRIVNRLNGTIEAMNQESNAGAWFRISFLYTS